jgi:hypothetical protein
MNMIGASPLSWAGAAIAASDERAARARRKVLEAMRTTVAPLSLKTVAALAGLSYFSAHRAMQTLCAMHRVEASGPANNRRFALIHVGAGQTAGGPASELGTAGACTSSQDTPAVRPGVAA